MKSLNQLSLDFLTFSNDPNAATLSKSLMNTAVHYVMSLEDWNFNKDSKTYTSTASQQDFTIPMNCAKVRYVEIYSGSLWYVPNEIKSGTLWRKLNYTPVYSDIPQFWYISNSTQKVSIFPIITSAGNLVKVGFTKKLKDLSAADYTTGTVSAVANGTAITGAGATFTTSMIGRSLQVSGTNTIVDGMWFDIIDVPTAATLTVKQMIPAAITGATYTISELIPFMDGFENIALFWALDVYYKTREMPALSTYYEKMWTTMLEDMRGRDMRSADSLLRQQNKIPALDPNSFAWGLSISEP